MRHHVESSEEQMMGERAVGVDITDVSLRAVDVRFGQARRAAEIRLPPGAVIDGEIIDAGQVTEALRALWKLGKFTTRKVVLGAPSSQVVAREARLPGLELDELRKALRFEAADLVPFALDDALLDCFVIERTFGADNTPVVDALVLAARRSTIVAWRDACRHARLSVVAVDHWATALVRALGPPPGGDEIELIVDMGSDSLGLVLHQGPTVRFARSLEGFSTTSSVSLEIEAELNRIEEFRRRIADGGTAVLQRPSVQRDPITDAVSTTLDYISYEQGAVTPTAVRLIGEEERVRLVSGQLTDLLGLRVSPVLRFMAPHRSGELIAPDRDLIAFGHAIATSRAHVETLPQLLPPSPPKYSSPRLRAGVAVASMAVGLGGSFLVGQSTTEQLDQVTAEVNVIRDQIIASRVAVARTAGSADAARANQLEAAITMVTDGAIDWPRLIDQIVAAAPENGQLLAITSQAAEKGLGSVVITVQASGQAASGAWIDALGVVDGLKDPWPQSSGTSLVNGVNVTTLTITASLTDSARLQRTVGT